MPTSITMCGAGESQVPKHTGQHQPLNRTPSASMWISPSCKH